MGLHFVLIFIQHKLQIALDLLQLQLTLQIWVCKPILTTNLVKKATPSVIITDSVKITDGGCTGLPSRRHCEHFHISVTLEDKQEVWGPIKHMTESPACTTKADAVVQR